MNTPYVSLDALDLIDGIGPDGIELLKRHGLRVLELEGCRHGFAETKNLHQSIKRAIEAAPAKRTKRAVRR